MSFDINNVKISKTTQLLVANNNIEKMTAFKNKEFKAVGYWLRKGAPKENFDVEKDTIGLIYEVEGQKVYISYFALKSFYVKDGSAAPSKAMNVDSLDDEGEMKAYNFTLREIHEKKYDFTVEYEDETPGVSSLPYFVDANEITGGMTLIKTGEKVYSPFVYKNISKIRKQFDEFADVWTNAFQQGVTNLRSNYEKQVECDLVVEVVA